MNNLSLDKFPQKNLENKKAFTLLSLILLKPKNRTKNRQNTYFHWSQFPFVVRKSTIVPIFAVLFGHKIMAHGGFGLDLESNLSFHLLRGIKLIQRLALRTRLDQWNRNWWDSGQWSWRFHRWSRWFHQWSWRRGFNQWNWDLSWWIGHFHRWRHHFHRWNWGLNWWNWALNRWNSGLNWWNRQMSCWKTHFHRPRLHIWDRNQRILQFGDQTWHQHQLQWSLGFIFVAESRICRVDGVSAAPHNLRHHFGNGNKTTSHFKKLVERKNVKLGEKEIFGEIPKLKFWRWQSWAKKDWGNFQKNLKKWTERERDNNECQLSGKKCRLNFHRKIPKNLFSKQLQQGYSSSIFINLKSSCSSESSSSSFGASEVVEGVWTSSW